ncbi:MAG: DUF6443 domain-containing protein [Dysgonomonas sp.]
MKKILLYICLCISLGTYSQSADQNYVRTRTYTKENQSNYIDQIQYFDGLGRPMQTVERGITPNAADLVTYQEYDAFGREANNWLPAVATSNNGAYMPLVSYKAKAMATYANDSAYSRPVYEASPLNRVLEQYGPGKEWRSDKKAVRTGYLTNKSRTGTTIFVAADSLACGLYKTVDDVKTISLSRTANYNANELHVTRFSDENGNISYEFKDKLGQVILTRQINAGGVYDTNYIYDSYGNLRAVLPPEASDRLLSSSAWLETDATLKQYAYLYKYDTRNRCIAKKIPGCEWVYYVYDKADRLIFTQDGEQRTKGEWLFSIPDALGRTVLTGTAKNIFDYTTNPLGTMVVNATWAKANNAYKGYTIIGVTITNPTILSANYYDNYEFMGLNTIPENTDNNFKYIAEAGYGTWYGTDYTDANKYKNKGMLTGTLTAQMNFDGTVSTAYLYSVMYYDTKKQLIQTKSNSHLTGGIEKEYIAYNFTGQPTQRKHIHSATGKNTQTEVYTYTYDHAGRLLTTTHQLTDGTTVKPQVTLAENTYDELGRLKTNKKGGVAGTLATYAYNVRSWTKSITSPLFSQTLYYNESYGSSTKQYNGNISAMNWLVQGETMLRGYTFTYDNLSRLTVANYLINGTANTNFKAAYIYDKHGNMKTLQRYGKTAASTYGLIDNLTMTHTGNQLLAANDAVANITLTESADFKNYSNVATEYTYNANGAMNKDLNKGISEIQYNSLNLPRQMVINSPIAKAKNYYTYSASGVKLKTEQRYDPSLNASPIGTTTPINDGLADYKNTDYVGNIIYETTKTGSSVINKTRIQVEGGYIENGVYYYYLTDHLGNNRVVINASGTVIQRNHYYPFGMAFAENTKAEQGLQPYKYNGKELDQMHGLNMYDYSARFYEPGIGRFSTVDPLAEKFYSWSPYTYCYNNPIKFIDPDGEFPIVPIIIFVALFLNSDVVVAPTGNPSDGSQIQEARDNYNMNNLGILVPLPGGSGASTLSGTVGKQFIKETGKQAEKQVAKEVEKQVGKQIGDEIISAGKRVDPKTGQKLGPSGKPMVHTIRKSSQKEAKDAARNDKSNGAKGTPPKHTKDQKGGKHFHNGSGVEGKGKKSKDYGSNAGKISNNVHYEYPE